MVPNEEADTPETVDPPFTVWSAEGLLIGCPIGVAMLIAAAALGLNIIAFKRFLLACLAAGMVASVVLSKRTLVEKRTGNQRTLLEMLILLGYASVVSYGLLKMFLEGRTP